MDNKEKKEIDLYEKMSIFEKNFWNNGLVVGVDEVGRGCLAGPLTICAYVFKPNTFILGVNDSKKLSEKKREEMYDKLLQVCEEYIIIDKSPEFIDENNIYQATKIAMTQAVLSLKCRPSMVLVDAMQLDIPYPQIKLIHGDEKSISIAAASIIAKVSRDKKMKELDEKYPGYYLSKHKGYCTRLHETAIRNLGISEIHRKSFCKKFINE